MQLWQRAVSSLCEVLVLLWVWFKRFDWIRFGPIGLDLIRFAMADMDPPKQQKQTPVTAVSKTNKKGVGVLCQIGLLCIFEVDGLQVRSFALK